MDEYIKELIVVLFPSVVAVIWKQIKLHQDVSILRKDYNVLQREIEQNQKDLKSLKTELHEAIKEQGKETNFAIQKLTEATAELITTTKIIAIEINYLKGKK